MYKRQSLSVPSASWCRVVGSLHHCSKALMSSLNHLKTVWVISRIEQQQPVTLGQLVSCLYPWRIGSSLLHNPLKYVVAAEICCLFSTVKGSDFVFSFILNFSSSLNNSWHRTSLLIWHNFIHQNQNKSN